MSYDNPATTRKLDAIDIENFKRAYVADSDDLWPLDRAYIVRDLRCLLESYEDLRRELANRRQCSTCFGTPHASGLPCICGGTNSADEENKGLRLAAMRAQDAVAHLTGELEIYKQHARSNDDAEHEGIMAGRKSAEYLMTIKTNALKEAVLRAETAEAEVASLRAYANTVADWRALEEHDREDAYNELTGAARGEETALRLLKAAVRR